MDKSCSKIMPYWDTHTVCRSCRGNSCTRATPCETCSLWTDDLWTKFAKCISRAERAKSVRSSVSRDAGSNQVPGKGPEGNQNLSLPSVGTLVPVTKVQTTSSFSVGDVHASSVEHVLSHDRSNMSGVNPGQIDVPRVGAQADLERRSRPRSRSSSFSLSRSPTPRRHSRRARSRGSSRRRHKRHKHYRSSSSSSGSRSYRRSRSRSLRKSRHRDHSLSRSPSRPVTSRNDDVASLARLVEQQGSFLKELSDRISSVVPNASKSAVTSSPSRTRSVIEDNSLLPQDSLEIRVGSEERLGISDEECDDEDKETPKDSLTYREAIERLRSRLGPSVCPVPEVLTKSSGASALDFFKESLPSTEVSLALPQSNSVMESLTRMNQRLKGEEEIPMTPLPVYPKSFKAGSFVALSSKPKIFQPSSYEALNPFISLDPPSSNPGLKDVLRQGSPVPSSLSVQFSTLENWEKLARAGIQIASHSELFLCGTLKTIQQESLSTDDMAEVSRYLQAVALSQTHLVEVLTRLAAGPLLARRDACLSASDLEPEVKQALRCQPIESSTVLGNKFPEVVKHYKEGLTHKSLQRAVVGSGRQYSTGFKKRSVKASETVSKPSNDLSVTVGPNSSRSTSVPEVKRQNKTPRKFSGRPNRFSKGSSGTKPTAP